MVLFKFAMPLALHGQQVLTENLRLACHLLIELALFVFVKDVTARDDPREVLPPARKHVNELVRAEVAILPFQAGCFHLLHGGNHLCGAAEH